MSLLRRASHESLSSSDLLVERHDDDGDPQSSANWKSARSSANAPDQNNTAPLNAVPAYNVSKAKRLSQVIVAAIYCLLAAGTVFGYAALKPVLIAEGVYRDSCSQDELDKGAYVCSEQEIRLNLMFTIAAVTTNVAALPIGVILDRFGPKVASIIGAVLLAVGAGILSLESKLPFDGFVPGYVFLALGGPFVFIPSFQLSNTFPRYSGLVLALLGGAFDASSAIFLLYRLIYEATDQAFKPRYFFLGYLAVPVFILVAQIFLMPSQSYQTVSEMLMQTDQDVSATHSSGHGRRQSGTSAPVDADLVEEHIRREEAAANVSGIAGTVQGLSASKQLLTPWFILIAQFSVIQMLRINFFIATVRPQYTFLLDSADQAGNINAVFDIALPLGGVVAVPFIGLLLDNTRTLTVLIILVSIATVIGLLGLVPHALWVAYLNIALFVLFRPFYYTCISDISAKVFGFATFGKVYGLIVCLSGMGTFAQTLLDQLVWKELHGNYRPANVALLVLGAATGVALVGYVAWKGRTSKRELLEREAEAAEGTERELLMPGAERNS